MNTVGKLDRQRNGTIFLRHNMKNAILLAALTLLFSGCAQIKNTYYVHGDGNKITATDNVNKSTKDLLDMAGSAYGEAATNQGGKP